MRLLGPIISVPLLFVEYIVFGLTIPGSSDAEISLKLANYSIAMTIPTTMYAAYKSYKDDSLTPFRHLLLPVGILVSLVGL